MAETADTTDTTDTTTGTAAGTTETENPVLEHVVVGGKTYDLGKAEDNVVLYLRAFDCGRTGAFFAQVGDYLIAFGPASNRTHTETVDGVEKVVDYGGIWRGATLKDVVYNDSALSLSDGQLVWTSSNDRTFKVVTSGVKIHDVPAVHPSDGDNREFSGSTTVNGSDYYKYAEVPLLVPRSVAEAVCSQAYEHVDAAIANGGDAYGKYVLDCSYGLCLRPDTPVRMADGSVKPIASVMVGDRVMAVDPGSGELVPDVVTEVSSGERPSWDEWTFSDGTVVGTVGRHRFFDASLGEFMYLEAWNEGERGVSFAGVQSGHGPALVSRVHHDEESEHHTLFTEKYNNYFAGGLLAGNRRSKRGAWL